MVDQGFSSQAGPVNIMYELEDAVQRPPIPPKEPEANTIPHENGAAYGYDSEQQQYHNQLGNLPTRSPSGYAPQLLENQQNSLVGIASAPQSPIGTSHSPQPSVGYAPPQETPPMGGHQSLAAASTVSPIDSYRESYQTQPDSGLRTGDASFTQPKYAGSEASYANYSNAPAAPQYSTPVTGYYAPPAQYNPNQSYGIGAAPYPPTQSPPPTKPEYSYFGGAAPPAPPPTAPVTSAAVVTPAVDGGKKKKKICGLSVTVFSLLCVILFLIIAGAVLGGIFGSGVLTKNKDNGDSSGSTEDPTSIVFPTSFPTDVISESTTEIPNLPRTTEPPTTEPPTTEPPTKTSSNYAYAIPTGTWTLTGGLTITTGTCINDLTATNYKEVWYCAENQTEIVVIKDFSSTSKLLFTLDLDDPVRVRGVQGVPPTGPDTDKGEAPFWMFTVPYTRQAFEGVSDCSVDVELVFLLGRTKAIFGFYEQVYSPTVCTLPHGGNSTAGISCGCGYL